MLILFYSYRHSEMPPAESSSSRSKLAALILLCPNTALTIGKGFQEMVRMCSTRLIPSTLSRPPNTACCDAPVC